MVLRTPAELEAIVAQHTEAVLRAAREAPAGGGAGWDAMLDHCQLAGVGPAERAATVRALGIERGAVPAEVLMVLQQLAAWGMQQLAVLGGDPRVHQVLRGLPGREVARYQAELPCRPPPPPAPATPAPPGLAEIFQNAVATTDQTGAVYPRHVEAVLSCPHCGAPQQQVGHYLCDFCRRALGGP